VSRVGGRSARLAASPPATEAEFLVSAAFRSQFPKPLDFEIALLGRSNCGKSSLLNRWLGRRTLARVGASPGRTRFINFFKVIWRPEERPMLVVDLPGYGFAAAPKQMVESWRRLVDDYLRSDRGPRLALLLMDCRRDVGEEELRLADWLDSMNLPFQMVATKSDKLASARLAAALGGIGRALGCVSKPLAFSSLSGRGREELIGLIDRRRLQAYGLEPIEESASPDESDDPPES
jgi:GTP-binding protein